MIYILVVCISLSIDALGIGLAYALRGIKVSGLPTIIIFLLSSSIMGLSLTVGSLLSVFLNEKSSKLIGIAILIFIGAQTIFKSLKKNTSGKANNLPENIETYGEKTIKEIMIKSMSISVKIIKHPEFGDTDNSKYIDAKEALLIGIALSIDSMGAGIGYAAIGINSIFVPCATGIFQLLFLQFGLKIGHYAKRLSKTEPKIWSVLSGIIIIVFGIVKIFI